MKKLLAIITALLFIGGLYGAWKINYPSYSFHYKLTVEIETPEGIKSGSAVRMVRVSRQPKIGDAPSVIFDVQGEAVVVDLGQRGVVFSLIKDTSDRDVYNALKTMDKDELKVGLKGFLSPENYPKFVMFKDIKHPKSVTLVYRDETFADTGRQHEDYFEKIFGAGVKIKSISIEITDEPVTWDVKNWLPWLPNYYDKRLDGDRFGSSSEIANTLSSGAFSTGEKR